MPKFLGQHFLTSRKKLHDIAKALDLGGSDLVIEVGPGHGELTGELVNSLNGKQGKWKIILVEKDVSLVEGLESKYEGNKNIEVLRGDVLKILPQLINRLTNQPTSYKLVGNIPYYITGHLFRIISELDKKPSLIVFTIQKEVAERICARPPRMNLLAASVQLWANPKIIGLVSKKLFRPMPKVDSAIIRLETKDKKQDKTSDHGYYKLIKAIFRQPRKTILNNLRQAIGNQEFLIKKLQSLGIKPQNRPQDLSIEELVELAKHFQL